MARRTNKPTKKRAQPRRRGRREDQAKNRAALKGRILSVIRGTGTRVWALQELMSAAGAVDQIEFLQCCNELVGDGYIHPGPVRSRYPYEDWPAFKPVPSTEGCLWELDLDALTPEQRAEWDQLEAEGKRSQELHERVGKKLEYICKVRDGLLPPLWASKIFGSSAAATQGSGGRTSEGSASGKPVLSASDAKLKAATERVVKRHPEGEQISKEKFWDELTEEMGQEVSRDNARDAMNEWAPQLKLPVGRPPINPNRSK
jgi:hypothetical protein